MSRRDILRIAQPFKAGLDERKGTSPEGTADRTRLISAVPSGLGSLAIDPGVETPGYYRLSLRDSSLRRPT